MHAAPPRQTILKLLRRIERAVQDNPTVNLILNPYAAHKTAEVKV